MRILTIALLFLIPISLYASAQPNSGGLAERVAELEAQVEELSAILEFVYVETEEINGLRGPHWIIEGANVHVRSGSGSTLDGCGARDPNYPNCESLTGLGNLIVGYNEPIRPRDPPGQFNIRTGSHNLVVGKFHSYSSFAGFVAGSQNKVTGAHASVSGGHRNEASGDSASVSGGQDRAALDHRNWAAGELFEEN